MNTSTAEFNKVHAAYEAMIISEDDTNVDPVLMEGYEDKLEENSAALKEQSQAEKAKNAKENFILDLPIYGRFFGAFTATVFVGYKVGEIYEWLSAMI